jgi:hypothetical protein
MTSAALRLACSATLAAVLGCSSDHDFLAQKPGTGSEGGADDSGGPEGFPVGPRDSSMTIDARDPEPPGPWVLTLMNGVVDSDVVRFCLVPVVDGGEAPSDDAPWPAGGLSFGGHVAVSKVGLDLATTDVHPYLVIGASGNDTCQELLRPDAGLASGDAGPPVAMSLPLIPAGTLADARSYLGVATGCAHPVAAPPSPADAGDATPDVDDGAARSAALCGSGFGPGTLGLSLVRLSRRTNFSKVGFQAVNGSGATAPASMLIENPRSNLTVFFADALALGQITPHALPALVDKGDLGVPVGAGLLHVDPSPGGPPFTGFTTTIAIVFASSGLEESDIVEGKNFTFVMLGPRPGPIGAGSANRFAVQLIRNDPDVAGD